MSGDDDLQGRRAVQLQAELFDVVAHGRHREVEVAGDLLWWMSLGEHPEDLELSVGDPVLRGGGRRVVAGGAAVTGSSGHRLGDDVEDRGEGGVDRHDRRRPGRHEPIDQVVVDVPATMVMTAEGGSLTVVRPRPALLRLSEMADHLDVLDPGGAAG